MVNIVEKNVLTIHLRNNWPESAFFSRKWWECVNVRFVCEPLRSYRAKGAWWRDVCWCRDLFYVCALFLNLWGPIGPTTRRVGVLFVPVLDVCVLFVCVNGLMGRARIASLTLVSSFMLPRTWLVICAQVCVHVIARWKVVDVEATNQFSLRTISWVLSV